VRGLAVRFGPLRALDAVDLTVGAGELVALAGENGAGKTTLVRCIAGDIAPAAGQVQLSGRPVPTDPAAVGRRGVAVVWQDLALCDNLDIAANMLLGQEGGRFLFSEARLHAKATGLLAELGIPLDDTTRGVRALSGGQRQLLAVARAMSRKPRLLILDEPTASLGVTESAQVEQLITALRGQGTSILLVTHEVEQMFRLADRVVVLRHGTVAGDVDVRTAHPDDVVALVSGQRVDSSARQQLTRLHGLVDRLASADPSSSLSLILSALGAALSAERLCIHLLEGEDLICAASLGLPPALLAAWSRLPSGPAGGPVGQAAATAEAVVDEDTRARGSWESFRELAAAARVGSSWSVPVLGPSGLIGVITVFRPQLGRPQRGELDLVTLYAGYAASAVERDRLLDQVTARNRVLETIREMLEELAGPVPVAESLVIALRSLCRGLQADEVALVSKTGDAGAAASGDRPQPGAEGGAGPDGGPEGGPEGAARYRAFAGTGVRRRPSRALLATAGEALAAPRGYGEARALPAAGAAQRLVVTFRAPGGSAALAAGWVEGQVPPDAIALLEDAAHSLQLALEREEAGKAHEETAALRRSQQLQRTFLSRLSHELRTPLTAIRGYASSLLQPDVTWDSDSQHRFLTRIAAESARLGRLVGDLLDFSAIESQILRLQCDWCELPLVIEAAAACLPPADAARVEISCAPGLPTVWADHDRLEQVFVNLLDNAFRHNPPGTRASVRARADGPGGVVVSVHDDGRGLPPELAGVPFENRRHHSPSAGAGLGLSIAKGIVEAHGGELRPEPVAGGTSFHIRLPSERPAKDAAAAGAAGGTKTNA
jgi:signal transduction histidine kinase/ABC-type multidrug transport system ATPase subunit